MLRPVHILCAVIGMTSLLAGMTGCTVNAESDRAGQGQASAREPPTSSSPAVDETSDELSGQIRPHTVTVCGTCPAGTYKSAATCVPACGGTCGGIFINASVCETIPGSGTINVCGTCPAGFYAAGITCTPACGGSCLPGSSNMTICTSLPACGSFTGCGFCPSGFTQTSITCIPACGGTCGGGSSNASVCRNNAHPSC